MEEILRVSHIKKSFGTQQVLKDVDFFVPKGSIYGFVGQNGAGKTTTMKAILGLHTIDDGEILVNGERVCFGNTATNHYIGYLPDVPQFYGFYTPREYLTFCGEITGMKGRELKNRIEEILELVGLSDVKKRIKGFSRGMNQRLGMAQALLNKPKLLICDEPTSALDPIGRMDILNIMLQAKQETTILFSTHILTDVERICDRVAFLHDGKITLSLDMKSVNENYNNNTIEIELVNKSDFEIIENAFNNSRLQENGRALIECDDKQKLLTYLVEHNIDWTSIHKGESSIETLFKNIVGGSL